MVIDLTDNLFKLSAYVNVYYTIPESVFNQQNIDIRNIDFIIPIATFDFFINNFKDEIKPLSFTWLFLIANELTIIHSNGFYHGNISQKTIGIYYNNETQTFVPSIILFYYLYKKDKFYKCDNKMSKLKNLDKNQQKDIKNFIKVSNSLIESPNNFLEKYTSESSIDEILFELHNFIIKNIKDERKNIFDKNYNFNNDYSSYQITYPIIQKIFYKIENKILLKGLFFEIEPTLKAILKYLSNTNSFPNKSINENIPQMDQFATNMLNKDEILNDFVNIKEKCSYILFHFVYENNPSNNPSDIIVQKDGKSVIFLEKQKNDIENELKFNNKPSFNIIHIS